MGHIEGESRDQIVLFNETLDNIVEICEHPFGSIKRNMGYSYFLMKGKDNVLTESCLAGFVHNFIRVFNILGTKKLMELVCG